MYILFAHVQAKHSSVLEPIQLVFVYVFKHRHLYNHSASLVIVTGPAGTQVVVPRPDSSAWSYPTLVLQLTVLTHCRSHTCHDPCARGTSHLRSFRCATLLFAVAAFFVCMPICTHALKWHVVLARRSCVGPGICKFDFASLFLVSSVW